MKTIPYNKRCGGVMVAMVLGASSIAGWAGSIFLTGHDSDFHASDSVGARHINQIAIDYITDPAFNPFAAALGASDKFLFVESLLSPPPGHRVGMNGIVSSGFVQGTDFERHSAATLGTELDLLGTKYSGIVVASDFGGLLTQAELDILNARSTDIIDFLNDGGGIFAMAESGSGSQLTTGGYFGYLPFVVSTTGLNQSEAGTTVTAFGTSLGLTDADVSSNFSHNIFDSTAGLDVVDRDSAGQILSLAGRGQVDPDTGIVPDAGYTLGMFGLALGALGWLRRKFVARG